MQQADVKPINNTSCKYTLFYPYEHFMKIHIFCSFEGGSDYYNY